MNKKPEEEVGEDVIHPDHEEMGVADPGTILNVDHRLASQDIVCWLLH